MLKAGSVLKETFDELRHVTCVAHALHRLAEFVRSKHSTSDEFVSLMKKILRKNNSNKKLYKEITKLPLPNHPVTSRWGTWLNSAIFYSNNISTILLFIENLDEHHSAASSKIHKLIENDLQTLKSELSNLSNVFQFLPIAITKLEACQLVVDADSVLNDVKISLPNC